MDTSKIVGEKIKALREDKSITIEELAQRSGLAIEQVERIENNIDIPSLAPLIKPAYWEFVWALSLTIRMK
jgi:transcriptional regulator with XRE-family HTH domain